MKLLDKLKTVLFEEDEEEKEQEKQEDVVINDETKTFSIAHKVDVERTNKEIANDSKTLNSVDRQEKKAPIIFEDEDFLSDTKEISFKEPFKKEEAVLYGGYEVKEKERVKEKFKPSPILSPVYGIIETKEEKEVTDNSKSLDHLFSSERKKDISFDEIRQKAYGDVGVKEQEDDDEQVIYDMKNDDTPGIEKVTIGDAEEYFEDLGLEYEVDYKDASKEKEKMTRIKKNQELSRKLEKEEEDKPLEEYDKVDDDYSIEDSLVEEKEEKEEKEQEDDTIKKIINKKDLKDEEDMELPEEKNLYDLIDMMYDNK